MSDYNLATWEMVAHMHIRHSLFISQAFVQVIILRLDLEIKKQMSLKFLFWAFLRHAETYKMMFLF